MKKIICIYGTRPEFIKMAPVIKKLKEKSWCEVVVVNTAQHRQLVDDLNTYFDIIPDYDLDSMVPNQTLEGLTSKLIGSISKCLDDERADAVLVQGDTTTAFIGALAAFYKKIPVGHVEAGLRTSDIYSPFPEEINRQLISRIATWSFAPTNLSSENLRSEGIPTKNITVTGNTVVDTLLKTDVQSVGDNNDTILVTLHRRENFGAPVLEVCRAIEKISELFPQYNIIFPVHPNPNIKGVVVDKLGNKPNIHLVDPLPYPEFMKQLKTCKIVISDSGGVQEEAPSLGTPLLILRESTERPEALQSLGVKLVGTNYENIVSAVQKLLTDEDYYREISVPNFVFGDGTASEKIEKVLSEYFLRD